jgi:hypothetical protein
MICANKFYIMTLNIIKINILVVLWKEFMTCLEASHQIYVANAGLA